MQEKNELPAKNFESVTMTRGQMLEIACAEILEQVEYFENKEFRPKNLDECKEYFLKLIEKEWISWDWVESVTSASISGQHIYIGLDKKWGWTFMAGMSKEKHTRDEFLKHLKKMASKVKSKDIRIKDPKNGPWGKRFFS